MSCDAEAPAPIPPSTHVRTDLYCTECGKQFIAKLDLGLDGNHVIECPWCGHEHCRVVTDGKVTGERWDSRKQNHHKVERRHVWKHNSLPAQTTSASRFIYELWLDRIDGEV